MAGNRSAAIKYILDGIAKIVPGSPDIERYKKYLNGLSDKEMDEYMQALRDRKKWLSIKVPNFAPYALNTERNFKLADELGLRIYKRIWMPNPDGKSSYLSPVERPVVFQPVRLASQRLLKKRSVPTTQRHVNMLTGQPTGASKGASFSFPEIRLCRAMGLESSVIELIKYRGGDLRGHAALTASLMRTGRASISVLSQFASGVESTKTLQAYFACMHLRLNA